MTAPTRSWRVTIARPLKRCFSTLHAAATRRPRRERTGREQSREPASRPSRHLRRNRPAPDRRDGAALLVSSDVVLASAAGADLLAGAADHHLGFPAELYLADVGVFRPRRRLADRRRDPVGHPVSRPAWLFDFVSRGDVGAQPRQPDD